MVSPERPVAPDTSTPVAQTDTLTEPQRQFAEIVGRRLAELWHQEVTTEKLPPEDQDS